MFNKIRAFAFATLVIIAIATLVAAVALALTMPRHSAHAVEAMTMPAEVNSYWYVS